MDWGRVKTILISLLLFINLFLFINILRQSSLDNSENISIRKDIISILNDENISFARNIDTSEIIQISDYSITSFGIDKLMQDILKNAPATDFGDGTISYESEFGTGLESFGGNFNIKLNNYNFPRNTSDAMEKTTEILKLIFNELYVHNNMKERLDENGDILDYSAEFGRIINGQEILNTTIKIVFNKDNSMQIAGVWFDEINIKNSKNITNGDILLEMKNHTKDTFIQEIHNKYLFDVKNQTIIPYIYVATNNASGYKTQNIFTQNLEKVDLVFNQDTKLWKMSEIK